MAGTKSRDLIFAAVSHHHFSTPAVFLLLSPPPDRLPFMTRFFSVTRERTMAAARNRFSNARIFSELFFFPFLLQTFFGAWPYTFFLGAGPRCGDEFVVCYCLKGARPLLRSHPYAGALFTLSGRFTVGSPDQMRDRILFGLVFFFPYNQSRSSPVTYSMTFFIGDESAMLCSLQL